MSKFLQSIGMSIFDTALGLGSNLFTGARDQRYALARIDAQKQATDELNENQYQRQLAYTDYVNEYNSPTAQRARLDEAGLNVGLMYGQGGTAAGNSLGPSVSGSSGAASSGVPAAQSPVVGLAQERLALAQARLAEARANEAEGKTPSSGVIDDYYRGLAAQGFSNAALNRFNLDFKRDTRDLEIAGLRNTVFKIQNEGLLALQRFANEGVNFQKLRQEVALTAARVINVRIDSALKRANIRVSEAQRAELFGRTLRYVYQNGLDAANTELSRLRSVYEPKESAARTRYFSESAATESALRSGKQSLLEHEGALKAKEVKYYGSKAVSSIVSNYASSIESVANGLFDTMKLRYFKGAFTGSR